MSRPVFQREMLNFDLLKEAQARLSDASAYSEEEVQWARDHLEDLFSAYETQSLLLQRQPGEIRALEDKLEDYRRVVERLEKARDKDNLPKLLEAGSRLAKALIERSREYATTENLQDMEAYVAVCRWYERARELRPDWSFPDTQDIAREFQPTASDRRFADAKEERIRSETRRVFSLGLVYGAVGTLAVLGLAWLVQQLG